VVVAVITATVINYVTRNEAANRNLNTNNASGIKPSPDAGTISNSNTDAVANAEPENASPPAKGQALMGTWTGTYGLLN
jgi:hypothetical protein